MLSTKHLVGDITDIPETWIFEYYLQLPEPLNGSDVNLKSIFSENDTNPSLFVFFSNRYNGYRFKDFSSGIGGDAVTLVQRIHNLPNAGQAIQKIKLDYENFLRTNKKSATTVKCNTISRKYKLAAINTRTWNKTDQEYWSEYHIPLKLLTAYGVQPLETLRFEDKETRQPYLIKGLHMYGFFRKDGTLYKIYRPFNKNAKFLTVKPHIHGADQLTYEKPYLVICSSMKDMLALCTLNFTNIEVIAPESESTTISAKNIAALKTKYKAICTLFDNDTAGMKAMNLYMETYNLGYAHIKFEKDLAECLKTHGLVSCRELVQPVIQKALTKSLKLGK